MAKQAGMGDNFYIDGVDLSGDVNSVDTIAAPQGLLDQTGIKQSAFSRFGGQRDGAISFTTLFNNNATPPPQAEHNTLAPRPTTDRVVSYFRGTVLGNPAATLNAKQVNYDWTRGTDGSLMGKVDTLGNQFGIEWGQMLTPGIRTDSSATAAGPGNSINTVTSLSFGGQAYLHVFSVTGTSVTVVVNDSADNSTFAPIAGFTFTAVAPGGAPQAQRLAVANTATIRQFLAVQTTGTFSNAQFAVVFIKNPVAGIVF